MLSPTIDARLTYLGAGPERPRYYAINSSRNVITRDPWTIKLADARLRTPRPSLDQEGFELFPHKSAVSDFCNPEELARIYAPEMEQLVAEVSGADQVVLCGLPVLRFSAGVPVSSELNILRPARFVHIDISDSKAPLLNERWRPKNTDRTVRRFAHYTLWRTFSPPPQDIPLALCDARSVAPSELVDADSIMDIPGKPVFSSVVVLVRYSPRHRWSYFPGMNRDEVLVFKSHDSDPAQPHHVPHSAFKDRSCGPGAAPRSSIEARAVAFWFARDSNGPTKRIVSGSP